MTHPSSDLPPVGALLNGHHWPDRVRVVRVEPRGTTRVLIEAVTLDDQPHLIISRLLKRTDLTGLAVEAEADRPALHGNPTGFRLAAEATRVRPAYTHDPQFAVSVARIDLPPYPSEAVYYMLTAYAGMDSTIEAMCWGGHDHLVKPCRTGGLLDSGDKRLAHRRETLRQQELIRLIENSARQLQVTPRELMQEVHSSKEKEWGARQALNTHLWQLRKKIGNDPNRDPYIMNVRGQGYKFASVV